jgi:hypothetical protein
MLDTLLNRRLVLFSPNSWSDRNDREVMETFALWRHDSLVFASCMAEGKETAHHWQVFADRGQGACIRFDRDRLAAAINVPWVSHGPVSYVAWRELTPYGYVDNRLPFVKRQVFRFEREYRVIATLPWEGSGDSKTAYALPIPLDCVTSVYVSGELPQPLFESLRVLIRGIPGCNRLPIRHSGLLRNENWSKALADTRHSIFQRGKPETEHIQQSPEFAALSDERLHHIYAVQEAVAVWHRLTAQGQLCENLTLTGEMAQEMERIMGLLACHDRRERSVAIWGHWLQEGQTWTFGQAITALEKQLRPLGVDFGKADSEAE